MANVPQEQDVQAFAEQLSARGASFEDVEGWFAKYGLGETKLGNELKTEVLTRVEQANIARGMNNGSIEPTKGAEIQPSLNTSLTEAGMTVDTEEPVDLDSDLFTLDEPVQIGLLDIQEQAPMNELVSASVGTAVGFINEGFSALTSVVADDAEQQMNSTGKLDVRELKEQEMVAIKQSFVALESEGEQALAEVKEELELLEMEPELLTVSKAFVEKMRALGISEKALELNTVATELYKQRHLEQILATAQEQGYEDASKFNLAGDFFELFVDGFGVFDRVQRRETVEGIKGEEQSVSDYNFLRSSDIRDIIENKWDTLTFEQQKDMLTQAVAAVKASETLAGNHNTFYAADVLQELEDALHGDYGRNDWVSWLEAAGATGSVVRLAKNTKPFITAMSIKLMKSRDAYYGISVTDEAEDIMAAMDEFVRAFDPEADVVNNLRISKETERVQRTTKAKKGQGKPRTVQTQKTTIRMGNSELGNVAQSVAPQTLRRLFEETTDPVKLMHQLGQDADKALTASMPAIPGEMFDGVSPRVVAGNSTIPVDSGLRGRVSPVELYQSRPLEQVIRADEVQIADLPRLGRIEQLSGETLSLHPEKSSIEFTPEGMSVTAKFGAMDELGFADFESAELAAKNLVGEEFEIVYKVPNRNEFVKVTDEQEVPYEYFVEIKYDRALAAKDAEAFADSSTQLSPNYLLRLFSTHSDRIDREIINNVSVLRDWDLGVVDRMQATLKPYTKTTGGKRKTINYLLADGDTAQVSYTLSEVNAKLLDKGLISKEITEDSTIWKGYTAVRQYYDDLADMKNMRVRSAMEEQGYKRIQSIDGVPSELQGIPRTFDEVLKDANVKEVYDVQAQAVVNKADIQMADEHVLVQLKKPEFINGTKHRTVLVRTADVQPLPQQVIPRRNGYMNLEYKDVGAKVVLKRGSRVDGVFDPDGGSAVLRLAKSTDEANQFLDEVITSTGKTRREVYQDRLPEGSVLEVQESRESLVQMADFGSSSDGVQVPRNLKARGNKPLKTVRGSVEVLNVEDRLTGSIRGMENTLNRDALDIHKNRFMSTYRKYMVNPGNGYPSSRTLDRSMFVSDMPKGAFKDASNLHNYTVNMEDLLGFRTDQEFNQVIQSLVEFVTRGKSSANAGEAVKVVATAMFIYGRPFFQIAGNLAQVTMLMARDPVRGTASVVEALMGAALVGGDKLGLPLSNLGAKAAGFKSKEELLVFFKSMETQGVFSAAKLDNILSNVRSGRKIRSQGIGSKSGRIATAPLGVLKGTQAFATDVSNLISYRHAMKVLDEKYPGMDPLSRLGQSKLNAIWRELSFNMNKVDALASETDAFTSGALIWTQHVYKGWKNTILQPVVKALTNKDISKNPSLWAESRAQAAGTVVALVAMFGGAGILPTEATLKLDEMARSSGLIQEGETLPVIMFEGVIDQMLREAFGVDMNVAERFSFSDAPVMGLSLSGLSEGVINLSSGGALVGTKVGNLIDTIQILNNTPHATEEDSMAMLKFFGEEFMSLFSGWTDYEKMRLAKNFGVYFTSNGSPLYTIDPDASVALLFSLRPDEASLRERILFGKKGGQEEANLYAKKIPELYARWFWSDMLTEQDNGSLTFEAYMNSVQKFFRYIDASTANMGANRLAQQAKTKFYSLILDPTGTFAPPEFMAKAKNMVDRVSKGYSNKEATALFEQLITLTDDPMLKKQAEQALTALTYNTKAIELEHELRAVHKKEAK